MHIAVKMRRVVARRPWLYWLACAILALGLAVLVNRQMAALEATKREWGATRRVLIATVDHRPGDVLQTDVRVVPVALVPAGALERADVDALVRQRVTVGEVVVSADLANPNGPAALADAGTSVIGITDPLARGVHIGNDVRVVAEGVVLADDARVVGLADDVVFVAVDAGSAAMVAAAAHDASASLVFVP